jgi:hypothetical protein
MSAWSQIRSYISWPTEALLVGPNTSSRRKWLVWAASCVFGLGLGLVSVRSVFLGFFTLKQDESIFTYFVATAALLFIPLVCLGFVLPRLGGPVLLLTAVVVVLTSLPAAEFSVLAALLVSLAVAGPMFLVGAGFTWSGLRPESASAPGEHS